MKKSLTFFITLIFLMMFAIPSFAFTNELPEVTTEFPTYPNSTGSTELLVVALVDPNIKSDVSVSVLIRHCESKKEYLVPLYDYNNYQSTIEITEPGYYEVFKAFYANNERSEYYPVEYVRFANYGDAATSVKVVIGDTASFVKENSGSRVNKIGESFPGVPTNINTPGQSFEIYQKVVLQESIDATRVDVENPTESSTEPPSTEYGGGDSLIDSEHPSDGTSNLYEKHENFNMWPIVIALIVLLFVGFLYFIKTKRKS